MRRTRVLAWGCVAAAACVGGDDTNVRQLTEADLVAPPPGDAVGTALSGTYRFVDFDVEGCRCRKGPVGFCASFTLAAATTMIVQKDGTITAGQSVTNLYKDGTFKGAGKTPILDTATGAQIGEALFVLLGRFRNVGDKVEMEQTSDTTITGVISGAWTDCDTRSRVRAVRDMAP